MRVRRSDGYFLMICSSSLMMILRIFALDLTISSELFNLVFECFGLLRALQDILLVDVAQADIAQ